MNIIKKISFVSLLFMVQSTLCMEGKLVPKPLWPDDGQEWTPIEQWQDVTPFAGQLVAYRTTGHDCDKPYKISADDPTCYGLVDPYYMLGDVGFDINGLATVDKGYWIDICQVAAARKVRNVKLQSSLLPRKYTSLRLLTFYEVHRLFDAIKKKELHCWADTDWRHRRSLLPAGDNLKTFFKLGNLTEKERRPYFWRQARKKVWPLQRLLHIARAESGAVFHGFPKEMVRKIAWHILDAEATEAQQKSKLDDPLVLE
jgi:hypothetical protein